MEIPAYLERLERHVHQDGSAIMVVGPSGSGKSALLAYWSERYRRNHPDAFLILHHVGVGTAGGDHHAIMRRIMVEIGERYQLDDPIPIDAAGIAAALPLWLGKVQRERLVIIIDALDQLDERGEIAWLPDYLQPNVRLIVSSVDSPMMDALREREWPELTVEPLTLGQRREIVRSFLGEIPTRFTPEQVRMMSRDTASANPLFLRTRLEELRQFRAGEVLNERIEGYLAAGDLDELYRQVLERLEAGHGAGLVRDVLLLVSASRRGLSGIELAELAGCASADLLPLLNRLNYHLSRREDLYAFFHDYLRRAVSLRYGIVPESLADVKLHLRIAEYFARQPISPRRIEEEPWQLLQSRSWLRLRECIAAIPMFMALTADGDSYQLLSYWLAIGDRHDMAAVYEESLARFESTAPSGEESAMALAAVGRFLSDAGHYEAAERCCRRALALREQVSGPAHRDVAAILDRLVGILYHTGRIAEAGELARRALEIRESASGADHPEITESLVHVGALLYAAGSYDEAEHLLRRGLALSERQGAGDSAMTAKILNNLGAIEIARGGLDAAFAFLRRALEINERLLGSGHPEVASNRVNLAFLLGERRQYGEAERHYRQALASGEKSLGPEHPQLAVILTNLGSMLRESGDLRAAEAPFRRALRIRERALGEKNLETLNSMIRLGLVLKRSGEMAEACRLYAASLEGLKEALGAEHPQVLRVREVLDAMYELG